MNAISAINKNYNVPMRSSNVQNPMVSESYYNVMEEPEQKSNVGKILTIALGILGVAGIGFGIYKHKQVAGLKDDVTKLTKQVEEKAKSLTQKDGELSTVNKALETAKNKIKELEEKLPEAVDKAKDAVKEGAEKVADTVKEGAEKIKKNGFFKRIGESIKNFFGKFGKKGGDVPKP